MNESIAITSVCPKNPNAFTGKQKEYWIEVQLVDELGKPISNMPYKVENEATRCNHARYEGSSDSNGVIRIDRINWLDLTLKIDAQKLANEMEFLPLALTRNPRTFQVEKKEKCFLLALKYSD